MIRALALIALLAVAQAAPSSGSSLNDSVKTFSKAVSAAVKKQAFMQAINQEVDRRSLAEADDNLVNCKAFVKSLTSPASQIEETTAAILAAVFPGIAVQLQMRIECDSSTASTACEALTNCTMLTDYDETPAKTECGTKPSLYGQKMMEAGANAASVMFYEVAGQATACEQLSTAEATCTADKKCSWDAAVKAKCILDPKWTIVTTANGCPSEAATLETVANAGGYTLAGLATDKGITLDATAKANAAAVSKPSAAPRAASLLLAVVVAAAAFLVA